MFDAMGAGELVGLDVDALTYDQAYDALSAAETLIARAASLQYRLLDRMRTSCPYGTDEWVAEDAALALRISGNSAHNRLHDAQRLSAELPLTAAALRDGRLTAVQARIILEETQGQQPDLTSALDTAITPRAGDLVPGRLRQEVRRLSMRLDPDGAERRHRREAADRHVWKRNLPDGMAEIGAVTTAEKVTAMWSRLTRLAHQQNDDRPIHQKRTDLLTDLVLGQPTGAGAAPAVETRVLIDLPTLLGLAANPAHLPGYGPIPPQLARTLAATSAWRRLVTDPITGAALDLGRTRYRPSAALAELIHARDPMCVFPNCTRRAVDLDHITAYAQLGRTDRDNLAPLCRRHHRAKTLRVWTYQRNPDGSYTWKGPHGRVYRVPPPRPYD